MPSRVVDLAWHEMILMTRAYHAFCKRAFGHYLHHSPESVIAVLEGRSDAAGVPLLFSIDGRVRPEDGFVWGEDDLGRLRGLQAHRWVDFDGAGFSGAGCASGGCGGGG